LLGDGEEVGVFHFYLLISGLGQKYVFFFMKSFLFEKKDIFAPKILFK